MAYSDNPVTLERRWADIRPLVEGVAEATWQVKPGHAKRHAFRLWEALRLAKKLGHTLPRYKITVVSETIVRAVRREETEATLIQELPLASSPAFIDTRQVSADGWLDTIQQTWNNRGASQKVYIPRAWLDRAQLEELWHWCQAEGLLLFEHEGAITLMPVEGNDDSAPFAWSPMEED